MADPIRDPDHDAAEAGARESLAPLELAAQVGARLRECGRSVATVESCTGGGIARLITAVAGSSDWFERGFVTYSNAAKSEMVGVSLELIARCGAVSVEVAAAMAEGGIRFSEADECIAVTGVAGPGGGSARNPVGAVCFGWAALSRETRCERIQFNGDRAAVREQSATHALAGLLALLRAE
ncbi:MAG: CinA family protein [Pseudohongiellaceae bacterium]